MKATINYSQEHKRHVMMISNDPSPRNAFNYASKHQDKLWSGRLWSKLKDGIMKEILIAKFSQNPYLNKLLLETKNKIIVENAGSKDCYWEMVAQILIGIQGFVVILNIILVIKSLLEIEQTVYGI